MSKAAACSTKTLDSIQRLALAKRLDREIRSLQRSRNEDRARIARRLAELRRTHGYLSLGFASVQAYAKERVGWGSAKVKSLLELQSRLPEQPLMREAFEAGEIDWSKAVLASRATKREPEREADWLQAAQELSSRKLEAKVCQTTGEEPRRGRWLALTAGEEMVIEEVLRALRSEGLDLGLGAALAELGRRALQGGSVGSSSYRFLLVQCDDCKRTTHPVGEEERSVDPVLADRLLCDAEIQDTRRKPVRVTRTIPPRVKNAIVARSGGQCEFPGCANRDYLEFHHGEGRGRGHDPDTMLHLCPGHHDGPHLGAVRIKGRWSTGLRFLRADGSLIGTKGGPKTASRDAGSVREPTEASRDAGRVREPTEASRDAGSVREPTEASRDAGSVREPTEASRDAGSVREPTEASRDDTPAPASADPHEQQALAQKVLERLEVPARQAESLLLQAVAEQPVLQCAEELVRAVLLRP